ncbi:MAG TPA: hypothetical protein VFR10_08295 [bacterium]|nr:hypothetical protein [bacterium]
MFAQFRRDAEAWCAGRLWQVRIPVLLYLLGVWIAHSRDARHQSIFYGMDFGIHELGHIVFGLFHNDVLTALGGSLLQCTAPLIAALMFYRQRDFFAISFAVAWFGTNLFEVAAYAGDAVARSLPLVTPGGGEPIHDWNYALATLGWLRYTESIATLHRFGAHLAMASSLAFGGWLITRMMIAPQPSTSSPESSESPASR